VAIPPDRREARRPPRERIGDPEPVEGQNARNQSRNSSLEAAIVAKCAKSMPKIAGSLHWSPGIPARSHLFPKRPHRLSRRPSQPSVFPIALRPFLCPIVPEIPDPTTPLSLQSLAPRLLATLPKIPHVPRRSPEGERGPQKPRNIAENRIITLPIIFITANLSNIPEIPDRRLKPIPFCARCALSPPPLRSGRVVPRTVDFHSLLAPLKLL